MRYGTAAVLAAAVMTALVTGPALAADKEVEALKKSVLSLQRQLATQQRTQAKTATFENRLKALEQEKAKSGRSQIPLEAKVAQIQSQLQSLATRVQALEQKTGTSGGSGGATLSQLDSRLDALEGAINLSGGKVTIQSSGGITLNAGSTVTVSGASMQVNAGTARYSGVLQSNTLITNSVVSSSYTPGAGNVW